MSEVKPCPFCGETPVIVEHFKEDLWRLTHRCKVMGPMVIDWTSDQNKLAQRWNTRILPPGYVMVPEEELRRLLKKLEKDPGQEDVGVAKSLVALTRGALYSWLTAARAGEG